MCTYICIAHHKHIVCFFIYSFIFHDILLFLFFLFLSGHAIPIGFTYVYVSSLFAHNCSLHLVMPQIYIRRSTHQIFTWLEFYHIISLNQNGNCRLFLIFFFCFFLFFFLVLFVSSSQNCLKWVQISLIKQYIHVCTTFSISFWWRRRGVRTT